VRYPRASQAAEDARPKLRNEMQDSFGLRNKLHRYCGSYVYPDRLQCAHEERLV
jgi:hypothetical protein